MSDVLKFLTDNPTFYLATVDNGKPKVRPFGFVMEFENKLYFCTNNQKDVYNQLKANPYIEISTTSANGEWIRLTGKAVFDSSNSAKAKVLELSPQVAGIYKTPDNPVFEVFFLEDGEATFYSFTSEPKVVKL